MLNNLTISVECTDLMDFTCDVLILKYAQAFYGADYAVANVLSSKRDLIGSLRPGEHLLLPTKQNSRPKMYFSSVLFRSTSLTIPRFATSPHPR